MSLAAYEVWWRLVDEISLNFSELFIIRKYLKIRLKNRGSPCYFLSSRGQKIKNITKIEQKKLFLCTFLVSFFMAFFAQKRIYTIYRGGSRTAATSKMKHFLIIVNGWEPLTIITKRSILDVAAALNSSLKYIIWLCVWLIFWTRSSIKLIYFRSLCRKMTEISPYFNTRTDVVQILIDDFFF